MIDTRLEQLKTIQPSELERPQTYQRIAALVDDYVIGNRVGDARQLKILLEDLVTQLKMNPGSELYEKYQLLLTKLTWVAVPFASENETEDLFRKHLLLASQDEIDFNQKAVGFMQFVFGDNQAVQARRNLVLGALKQNDELIGGKPIKIEGEIEPQKPAIKNWLRDYDQISRLEQRRERLSLLEYTNTNQNIRILSATEKEILRQVFGLYDLVRFMVQSPTVIETGHTLPTELTSPVEEISETIPAPVTEVANMDFVLQQEVLAAYRGDTEQQQAVVKELKKLESKSKGDMAWLHQEFFTAVQKQNMVRTVALLRLLAEKGDLENFMVTDEKLGKFLAATWEKQYGAATAQEFQANPAQPKFLSLFLQYILQQRLGMSENDAARVGLQIGNIFVNAGKKGYNKIAYFDVTTKVFQWFEE